MAEQWNLDMNIDDGSFLAALGDDPFGNNNVVNDNEAGMVVNPDNQELQEQQQHPLPQQPQHMPLQQQRQPHVPLQQPLPRPQQQQPRPPGVQAQAAQRQPAVQKPGQHLAPGQNLVGPQRRPRTGGNGVGVAPYPRRAQISGDALSDLVSLVNRLNSFAARMKCWGERDDISPAEIPRMAADVQGFAAHMMNQYATVIRGVLQ